jgi:hypothetical protein
LDSKSHKIDSNMDGQAWAYKAYASCSYCHYFEGNLLRPTLAFSVVLGGKWRPCPSFFSTDSYSLCVPYSILDSDSFIMPSFHLLFRRLLPIRSIHHTSFARSCGHYSLMQNSHCMSYQQTPPYCGPRTCSAIGTFGYFVADANCHLTL